MIDPSTPLEAGRPTLVRWRILALLMAYAAMCHFNRISMGVAGTEQLIDEYSIKETTVGIVVSAYLVVYTLCMTPGGWLIDRYGPRMALVWMGFGSAVLVPLTGLAGAARTAGMLVAALLAVRGLLGLVSAPIHPGAARLTSFWFPSQGRSAANGLITGSAVVGIASTFFVFGFLMDRFGWPRAFVVAGVFTFLLTVLWAAYATDYPAQHRSVNGQERHLIEQSDPSPQSRIDPSNPAPADCDGASGERIGVWAEMKPLIRNRSLILLTISYAAVGYFEYLFFYWIDYYFAKVLELGKEDSRLYATIPNLAMAVGMAMGGWLADRSQERFGDRAGRRLVPVSGMIASALLLGLGITCRQPTWVVIWFALAMAAVGACEAPFWVTGIELGRRQGGTSAAILNTGGNAGGLLAPVVTPLFSEYFGWQAGLSLACVFCLMGAVLWYWIDPAER